MTKDMMTLVDELDEAISESYGVCPRFIDPPREKEIRAQLQAIADSYPEWISVEDRFPDHKKNNERYVFVTDGVDFVHGARVMDGYFLLETSHPLTHWMPLPALPTQESVPRN